MFNQNKYKGDLEQGKVLAVNKLTGRVTLFMKNGLQSAATYLYDINDLRVGMSVLYARVDDSYIIINKMSNVPGISKPVSLIRPGSESWHLVPSNAYYTDIIGGGIGRIAVMSQGNSNGRNDDDYMYYSLGFPFSFFGETYTSCYVNNNGNISFRNGLSQYVPIGPTGSPVPIISIFFADVDTRNEASAVVRIRDDIPNQLIVTWDGVGRYNSYGDLLNYFQLVIRGTEYRVPVGEGRIGFFYKSMVWETCNTSQTAATGFGDGNSTAVVIPGSNQPGLINIIAGKRVWFSARFLRFS